MSDSREKLSETDLAEHPLINFPALMHILLREAVGGTTLDDCFEEVGRELKLAQVDLGASRAEVLKRLGHARLHAAKAGLIESDNDERFHLTDRGRDVLQDHPDGIDDSVLSQFPEFQAYLSEIGGSPPPLDERTGDYDLGYAAFAEGADLADNPYPFDSIGHLAWENGWFEARDEAEIPGR